MKNKTLLGAAALSILIGSVSTSKADVPGIGTGGFNIADLFNSALSVSCMDWQPTGVCFWLDCNLFICTIKTTLRVRHYLPDAVVSVYKHPDNYPWKDVQMLRGAMDLGQSGSSPASLSLRTSTKTANSPVQRRMVDVVGNPGSLITASVLSSAGVGCDSQITPFKPYFLSDLDFFSWRFPATELIEHSLDIFVPGKREVGFRQDGDDSMLFTGRWGSVYPRNGSLMQMDDYKASAVFAQRAIDIATDNSAAHVYQQLEADKKPGVWPPGQAHEAKSESGKWQMVYPEPEQECHIFGDESRWNTSLSLKNKRSTSGDYGWVYWRPWECCESKGIFLMSVSTTGKGNDE